MQPWHVIPPYYARGVGGVPTYRRFVGAPPTSPCNAAHTEAECDRVRQQTQLQCYWRERDVLGRAAHCHGPPGSVTAQFPYGASVRYMPAMGQSACNLFNYDRDSCRRQGCTWVEGAGGTYCRTSSSGIVPQMSARFATAGAEEGRPLYMRPGWSGSGRFYPNRFADEQKASWFPAAQQHWFLPPKRS